MSPDQQEFIRTVGIMASVAFALTFIANLVAAIVNYAERSLQTAKICAIISAVGFVLLCVSLFLTFLSLG